MCRSCYHRIYYGALCNGITAFSLTENLSIGVSTGDSGVTTMTNIVTIGSVLKSNTVASNGRPPPKQSMTEAIN